MTTATAVPSAGHVSLIRGFIQREIERRQLAGQNRVGGFPPIEEARAALDSLRAIEQSVEGV